jgi:uncharacterized protein
MRRREREIEDPNEIRRILKAGRICRVAFCHESWPYVVPVNYGVSGDRLYLHSAGTGLKLDLLRANPRVCFEVTSEADILPGDRACDTAVRYESVIGWGTASIVEDVDERQEGLLALVEQLQLAGTPLPHPAPPGIAIVRIDVGFLRGKSSRTESRSDVD